MKAFFLTLLAGLPLFALGQITLTVSDFSDGGDAVWMSTTLDPTIDFSSTGPNYNWDFSSLTYQDQELREYSNMSSASGLVNIVFGAFASPEYQATNYTASTAIPLDQISGVLPVNLSDVNQYSRNASDGITSVGFSLSVEGNEVPFKSDVIETRYALPLDYNDTYTSSGYSNLDMNPFYDAIWRQNRTRTSVVDGWGSITTPYGTFDALRIDHFIEETDSIYISGFGQGFWVELPIPDSHLYEWWTNNEKEPILRITTTDILGLETVTGIEYKDNYQGPGAGLKELDLSLKVYPNPASDQLNIEGLQSEMNYKIVGLDGRVHVTGSVSPMNNSIDLNHLDAGAYNCVVYENGGFISKSFIKK